MKVSFYGATKEVTGSCILIETEETNFLVDCGMFQGHGSYDKNLDDFGFDPKKIDFILLTHAHLDHCGRIPKLIQNGFKGKIYSTPATKDLAMIILEDSLRIFEKDGRVPLFNRTDLEKTRNYFSYCDYDDEVNLGSVKFIARDAGHILGSCIFEVFIEGKKIVFSGDIGNNDQPLVRDTYSIDSADVVFVESTYGGRIHEKRSLGIDKFNNTIADVVNKGGILLIPSFSIERTQELLYYFNDLIENKKIPFVKIFLDSPLAIKATRIYEKYSDLFDEDAQKLISKGDDVFDFDGFKESKNIRQSMRIIKEDDPKIILAGSGMCSGGRMPYYLLHYLSDKNTTVLFVSFQAEGTLGRDIERKGKSVKIGERNIALNARIEKIESFSSHADSLKLNKWVNKINPKKVFINHGDLEQSEALKNNLICGDCIIAEVDRKFII
jgi:metallo-beta-lactamase family protein